MPSARTWISAPGQAAGCSRWLRRSSIPPPRTWPNSGKPSARAMPRGPGRRSQFGAPGTVARGGYENRLRAMLDKVDMSSPGTPDGAAVGADDYVSSRDALRILQVKPQTLYSYVSRGLIRRQAK